MHMADALLSPKVGGVMWIVSAVAIAVSTRKLKEDPDTARVPLMGALGAFVFASQMINFSIPGTGSSGHFMGTMLLAIILGPHAAFLVLVSILAVQALLFADGGILALGANIFNMGFYTCFIAYPLLYRPLSGDNSCRARVFGAAVVASVFGMSAGAFSIVVQTVLSGISVLSFGLFAVMMILIHFVIGIVEGIVTGLIVITVPGVNPGIQNHKTMFFTSLQRKTVIVICMLAILIGGVFSWFASSHPDGLEWSIARVTGGAELEEREGVLFNVSSWIQGKLSFFPDNGFQGRDAGNSTTSISGLIGGVIILSIILIVGYLMKKKTHRASTRKDPHD